MKKWWIPLAAAAVAIAPVVARTPKPQVATPEGVRILHDAVAVCRDSGLTDWDLVEFAQQLVHRKFTRYSILSVWESPAWAFKNSRGYCNQYNTSLWWLLRELGFDAERVFATRVRQDVNPWWRMGHMWVRVAIEGLTLDVCAGMPDNRPGRVQFTPITDVRSFRAWTYVNTNNGMILFTVWNVWRSMLTRQPLPRWMEREFGTTVREHEPG